MQYILTIDEGTTSTRALLISESGQILDIVQKPITQHYPQPGWVEHDPLEIWNKTLECCREIIKTNLDQNKIKKDSISSIAITNQRETTIIWDPKTGKPVHNAIVWQCRRTSERCKELSEDTINGKSFAAYISAKTGLILDAYFSATKIEWIMKRTPHHEDLLFGTIDTWLIWNLTIGREHLTDASNASRTMLYDIHQDSWDKNILDKLNIPMTLLPKVIESNGDFGSSPLFKDLLGVELPIKAVLGDQQAALYAYANEPKCTYGTGTFIMMPYKHIEFDNENLKQKIRIGDERDDISFAPNIDSNGLLKSSAYRTQTEKGIALEGSIFVGGSIIQWLRDEMKFIEKSSEIETLANSVNDNGGVYLIPALSGIGAPFWRGDIRGTIFGITRGTNRAHIARAALESIAFRVRDIFEALDPLLRKSISHLNVDGGASKNDTLMQFQADLLQIPIKRYIDTEMTALGVAKMTGKIKLELKAEKIFSPQSNQDQLYKEWSKYLKLLLA